MKNKKSLSKLIFVSLIGLTLETGCNPGTAEETVGSTSSSGIELSSSSFDDSDGQSQTSIIVQMTTSGEPNPTDSITETSSVTQTSETTESITTGSSTPVCGNGIVESPEECDELNPSPSLCTKECKIPICGDGFLDSAKEQCDDQNLNEWDKCSNECLNNRIVFLTTNFIGLANFGGLQIADEFCQSEAKFFGLSGLYKAWLSDDAFETSPSFRFNSSDFEGWYVLDDEKTPIAKGWIDLTDGELINSINIQSDGIVDNDNLVWTATNPDGTKNINGACSNWTTVNVGSGFNTVTGKSNSLNTEWSVVEDSCGSEILKKLYCFQVE